MTESLHRFSWKDARFFCNRRSMKTSILSEAFLKKRREKKKKKRKEKQLVQVGFKFTVSSEGYLPLVNLLLTGIS